MGQLRKHRYTDKKPHLVRCIRAQDVQRRRDELGLDRHRIAALLLTSSQSPLDCVYAGWVVACQLDVSPEFDGLRCQSSGDGGRKQLPGLLSRRRLQCREHSVLFAIPL